MTNDEQTAIFTLCLMAAFADGGKDERERAQISAIAGSLSGSTAAIDFARAHQDVLLKRRSLADTVAVLSAGDLRQLAYEMAVCVCDADGAQNDAERRFLTELRNALGLDPALAAEFDRQADAVAAAPVNAAPPASIIAAQPADAVALDRSILNYSILNGALELLPQSLATMAIIPLQMKMVYAIGRAHGYELDRAHIKELLATLGVGLTSQYVEEFARKLIGCVFRKVAGSLGAALGRQATGSAMAFATTYALGHVAKRYYSTGRTLSVDTLKSTFQALVGEAQTLRSRHAGEIEQRARTLDVAQLLAMVKQP